MKKEPYLILHNVRSAHNVGAIFRTADAAGVSKIFLIGYTPLPYDRFGRRSKEILKTALGAEASVPWQWSRTITPIINKLKSAKVEVVALEQAPNSVDYKKFRPKGSFALIVGNEVSGLPTVLLRQCDQIIQIPMRGMKESLNVSVSTGIALFRLVGI